jgi:hypothetical protein
MQQIYIPLHFRVLQPTSAPSQRLLSLVKLGHPPQKIPHGGTKPLYSNFCPSDIFERPIQLVPMCVLKLLQLSFPDYETALQNKGLFHRFLQGCFPGHKTEPFVGPTILRFLYAGTSIGVF